MIAIRKTHYNRVGLFGVYIILHKTNTSCFSKSDNFLSFDLSSLSCLFLDLCFILDQPIIGLGNPI